MALETGDWLDWSNLVEQTTPKRQVVFHFLCFIVEIYCQILKSLGFSLK